MVKGDVDSDVVASCHLLQQQPTHRHPKKFSDPSFNILLKYGDDSG